MEERDGWMQRTEEEREGEIRERKEIRGRKARKEERGWTQMVERERVVTMFCLQKILPRQNQEELSQFQSQVPQQQFHVSKHVSELIQ